MASDLLLQAPQGLCRKSVVHSDDAAVTRMTSAGVEFVTPIGNCTNKVDTIGDGKDLFIAAGPNVQFEVFGNSVDLSNPTSGFRIATDSGAGNVTPLS